MGERGGSELNILTVNQLPSHTHTLQVLEAPGDMALPGGNVPAGSKADGRGTVDTPYAATADDALNSLAITNTGGSQPVNNIQPFQCVNFIIAIVGTFPSRN